MAVSSANDPRASRRTLAPAAARSNREDRTLPTHLDELFSAWKVLVGPDDWQNHFNGQEGAVKYRLHNLPSRDCFHSGVYELALYHGKNIHHAHGTRKGTSNPLKKDSLLPVYVGQTENVRERLQDYGRSGSHLEGTPDLLQNGKCQQCGATLLELCQTKCGVPKAYPSDNFDGACSSPHLFTKTFCQGYSIAFRWTATKNKVNAAALETYLLKNYDYAWNKGSNGERRPEHAFRKLQHITKSRAWYVPSKWTIKLDKMKVGKVRNLRERRIALIAVKEKLWRLDNPATRLSDTAEVSFKFLFFFWRRQEKKEKSLPSFPQHCSHIHDGHLEMRSSVASVCGIVDVSGMICKKAPVPGRKRCNEHKGMRLCLRPADDSSILAIKHFVTGPTAITVCGIIDGCGIVCKDMPLPGRKRCKAHKGMRICFRPGNDPDKEASCNGAK